ncbi:hypothetical protein CYCD_20710 [Tenuifilaceae bacterium CYCD]|nr:hypothetical protein CYCD_20710 [Tenuifilaceae bacterium CYCD]
MKSRFPWKITIILVFSTSFCFAQTDYYTLGIQEYNNQNFDKAINLFTKYINSDNSDNAKKGSSSLLKSISYYALGNIDSAYSSIAFMSNYRPNNDQKKIMYYYMANYETVLKNDNKAIDLLKKSIDAKDDDNAYVYLLRADIYMQKSQLSSAENDWQTCAKKDKKGIYNAYAQYYLGNYTSSLQSLFEYLTFNPNSNVYYDASTYFCYIGDYNTCFKYLRLALDMGFKGKGYIINNKVFLRIKNNPDFINLMKTYFPEQQINIVEVDTSYFANYKNYKEQNNIPPYSNKLLTRTTNSCESTMESTSNKPDVVAYTYDNVTFYFEINKNYFEKDVCIAYNSFLNKAYALEFNSPLDLRKARKVNFYSLKNNKYFSLSQSLLYTQTISNETGMFKTNTSGKDMYSKNYTIYQYDCLSKLLTLLNEDERELIANLIRDGFSRIENRNAIISDVITNDGSMKEDLYKYLLENESEIANVSKILNISLGKSVLMYKYNIAQQKEIDQMGLFASKDEFETEKQFQERKTKFEEQKAIILKKYDKLKQDATINLIQNSYSHIILSIDKIGNYNAETQKLPITINNKTEQILIPLSEAKSFKENIQKVKVSGDKQLIADGFTYDIFNIKVVHPITGSSYNFGIQKAPLYTDIITDNIENGVPKLVATASSLQELSGNGLLDGDESGIITVKIKNEGEGTARNIKIELVGSDIIKGLQYDNVQRISGIAPKQEQSINFNLKTDRTIQTYKDITFTFNISEEKGFNPPPINYTFSTQAFKEPKLVFIESRIKEITGNNNNIIENNEVIEASILIQNQGQGVSQNTQAVIKINDPNIICTTPKNLNQVIGSLEPGASKVLTFNFSVNNEYEGNDILPVEIILSEKYQSYGCISPLGLQMKKILMAATNLKTTGTFDQTIQIKEVSMSSDVDKNIPESKIIKTNVFALIIGNEDYSSYQQNLSSEVNVEFAKNDAQVFKEYINKTLGIPNENITLLLDAKSIEMNRSIEKLNLIAKNSNGDCELIFYYAGHGLPDENTKEAYIMPVDVSGTDLKFAIKVNELYKKLTQFPTKKVTVFLDACFSGGARNNALVAARGVKIKPKIDAISGNMVVFAASNGEQSSLPYKEKQHGMFTYFLLKKLQEKSGNVSYAELSNYLIKEVSLKSVLVNNKEQNPQVLFSPQIDQIWSTWIIK